MEKIVTFGEIMMRLNPQGYYRFLQANAWESSFAGGEVNVAVSLANYGLKSEFVTKLPKNDLGKAAINAIRHWGVGVGNIKMDGPRIGIFFVEKGASQRASKVIYDRSGSSIAMAKSDDFNWNEIFDDCTWFHFTGITPALGGNMPAICLEACKVARAKGITVSCDLNYRAKLWNREEACNVMSKLLPYVNVCIANEVDADDVFGIRAMDMDVNSGKLDSKEYINVASQICKRFGCQKVAITLRGSLSASVNEWSGMLYDGKDAYFSPKYTIQIVDRVGGGDSFGAGLIYSLVNGYRMQDSINFAVAASCLKHSIEHDFNLVTLEEVESLVAGNESGRVQR